MFHGDNSQAGKVKSKEMGPVFEKCFTLSWIPFSGERRVSA